MGVLINDDRQRCGFVDERGRHVSPQAIARFLVPPMLARSSGATILLEPGALVKCVPSWRRSGDDANRAKAVRTACRRDA